MAPNAVSRSDAPGNARSEFSHRAGAGRRAPHVRIRGAYRRVALWSTGQARATYLTQMRTDLAAYFARLVDVVVCIERTPVGRRVVAVRWARKTG